MADTRLPEASLEAVLLGDGLEVLGLRLGLVDLDLLRMDAEHAAAGEGGGPGGDPAEGLETAVLAEVYNLSNAQNKVIIILYSVQSCMLSTGNKTDSGNSPQGTVKGAVEGPKFRSGS